MMLGALGMGLQEAEGGFEAGESVVWCLWGESREPGCGVVRTVCNSLSYPSSLRQRLAGVEVSGNMGFRVLSSLYRSVLWLTRARDWISPLQGAEMLSQGTRAKKQTQIWT